MSTLEATLIVIAVLAAIYITSFITWFYLRVIHGTWLEERKHEEQRRAIRDRLMYEERWEDLRSVDKYYKDYDNKSA